MGDMGISRLVELIHLSYIESMRILRSSKCLILIICAVFININIFDPIRELSQKMGSKVSVFEPFVALSNSSRVLLFIPLLFIVMMSEFPDNSSFQYFYSIRTSKRRWIAIQMITIYMSSIMYLLVIIMFSVMFSADHISFGMQFSDAVKYYSASFPELSNSYVAQLFPLNMLNQLSMLEVVIYSVITLYLYLTFLVKVILFFSILRKKSVGIIVDFLIIFLGTAFSSVRSDLQWLFPLAHTISWGHFEEVSSKPVFPLELSIAYMFVINVVITVLIFANSKKVRPQ